MSKTKILFFFNFQPVSDIVLSLFGRQMLALTELSGILLELLLLAYFFSVEVSHWRHTKSVSRLGLWSVGIYDL